MKLKLDENGHVVVVDGKPIYVGDDGKDYPMDVPHMYGKITSLTSENKDLRTEKVALDAKVKAFEGIEDPEEAKRALIVVKNLDEKKLVDAGKIDEIKAAAVKAHEEQAAAAAKTHATELAKVTGERDEILNRYNTEKINGLFVGSDFIEKKVAIPPDFFQARFGSAFKVEEGVVVAYGADGNKIYSRTKPGEIADFEEAIEILVENYPKKAEILKGTDQSGGGGRETSNPTGQHRKEKDADLGGSKTQRASAIRNMFPDLPKAG